MPRYLLPALLAATLLAAGCTRTHDLPNAFAWAGTVPAGSWVRIRNINGTITVERAPSAQVEVSASKHWRRGNPADVRFVRMQSGSNVIICTMYGRRGTCSEDRYETSTPSSWWRFWRRSSNVRVDYVVKLPPGVKVDVSTVNGRLAVGGAAAEVVAETVNGIVDVTTSSGPVRAESVNGSVTARIDSLSDPGDIRIETVNGSVAAELPERLDGHLEMETVNGRVTTDYPLTATGARDPHHLRATLGAGGRRIRLETVNGSVTLRKRG